MKNNIAKDTVFLTAMQLATQVLSLLLNIFINNMLGTENLGIMSLISAFFTFAIIISNGNIFVSASRFIAEECGKADGNPGKIFKYSAFFSLMLSIISAAAVYFSAAAVSEKILKNMDCLISIRLLAFSLPFAALNSCFKGYFNAYRRVIIPASCEVASFLIKSSVMAISAGLLIKQEKITLYNAIAVSTLCSEISSFIMLCVFLIKENINYNKNKTVSFPKYIKALIPVMLNSYIPCILSTANDALVPVTLKQSGCSTADALGKYGLFEAVVLPVIFFPSMLLSCLSVILIPEISKQRACGENIKNLDLITDVIKKTITYSVFIVSIIAVYGNEIGMLAGHDIYAGKMIVMLAPVIPFIYLEIVLEGVIKGLGKHSFSSVNYLAEYIIRISALLICVPLTGYYGIVISYYLSNIVCNIARLVLISRIYSINFSIREFLFTPLISVLIAWQTGLVIKNLINFENIVLQMSIYVLFTAAVYIFVCKAVENIKSSNIIRNFT